MARIARSALELIGNTPLVELRRVAPPSSARLLGKLESLNPSGSVKDRAALALLADAEAQGKARPGDTLVWASSGNSGVSLALTAAAKGYRIAVFMPSNTPPNQRRLLQRLGASIQLTSPNGGMRGAHDAARHLAAGAGHVLLDLFGNPSVAATHYDHTGLEILEALGGPPDAFVAGVGTGGTITGAGRRLKDANPRTLVIAVEPAGSPVLSGGAPGRHQIPGIGADFMPPLLDRSLLDRIVAVTDDEANRMALRLAREEGLLVGISSGACVAAALPIAQELGSGCTVVTILADTGERYLDFPT